MSSSHKSPQQIPIPFTIPHSPKPIECLRYSRSKASTPQLIFTHGAGGTLHSDAIANFASGFAQMSPAVTFQGNMNLKSRVKLFGAVIESESFATCLGGRSMGARAAVLAATDETEKLVLVSYPLEGGDERSQILLDLDEGVEVLFVVGERDELCNLKQLEEVRRKMKCKAWLVVVKGADHGMNFKPRSVIGEVGERTGRTAAEWIKSHGMETESEIYFDEVENAVVQGTWTAGSISKRVAQGKQQGENRTKGATKSSRKKRESKRSPVPVLTEDRAETRASKRRRKG